MLKSSSLEHKSALGYIKKAIELRDVIKFAKQQTREEGENHGFSQYEISTNSL